MSVRWIVFLGSRWPERDEDGKLSAEAWLWSPRR